MQLCRPCGRPSRGPALSWCPGCPGRPGGRTETWGTNGNSYSGRGTNRKHSIAHGARQAQRGLNAIQGRACSLLQAAREANVESQVQADRDIGCRVQLQHLATSDWLMMCLMTDSLSKSATRCTTCCVAEPPKMAFVSRGYSIASCTVRARLLRVVFLFLSSTQRPKTA